MWMFFKFNFKGFCDSLNKASIISFFLTIIIQIGIILYLNLGSASSKHVLGYNIGGIIINGLIVAVIVHIIWGMFTKPYPNKNSRK